MKATGIVRKVDELGRIVFPKDLRRVLDIEIKDSLEIYVEGNKILLNKYKPSCIFCGGTENLLDYKHKKICVNCINELKAK